MPCASLVTFNSLNFSSLSAITKEVSGVESRILQHEIDHLSGRLFVDYLSSLKRNIMIKKVQKFLKNKK